MVYTVSFLPFQILQEEFWEKGDGTTSWCAKNPTGQPHQQCKPEDEAQKQSGKSRLCGEELGEFGSVSLRCLRVIK